MYRIQWAFCSKIQNKTNGIYNLAMLILMEKMGSSYLWIACRFYDVLVVV